MNYPYPLSALESRMKPVKALFKLSSGDVTLPYLSVRTVSLVDLS